MKNHEKFLELRNKYPEFIYENYQIIDEVDSFKLVFDFKIPNLTEFHPTTTIPKSTLNNKNINDEYFNELVFHIGLIELVSYFKCTCSPNVIIKCGYLDEEQIKWFKKLYYNGLGEFLYLNGINVSEEDLMHITCLKEKIELPKIDYKGIGNLIPIGGGKDSVVTLEILNEEKEINTPFIINPKEVTINSCLVDGYKEDEILCVKRTIDKNLIELNKEGYLNGHTPFSSLVAFLTYLCAYLSGKRYILLSNEASANEPTVPGTNINHQYSKTFEFEQDFNLYTKKYFNIEIDYFSFLRPLHEIQIGYLFSKYKKYHNIIRSCNVGSKNNPWNWCCNCPKCLFVYIILSPFLTKEELINMFGEDLYQKSELLDTFKELLGYSETKPFECIGTYGEVRLAVSLTIKNYKGELPYLLNYYQENYSLELDDSILNSYNEENNLTIEFNKLLKGALMKENNIIKNLQNKNIAILGFGKEGKSTYNFIRKHLPNEKITILDGNEKLLENNVELKNDSNLDFVLGTSYLENLNHYDIIIKAPGVVLKDVDITEFQHKITSQMGLVLDHTNHFMIGITGTKGKSTTANLIHKVLVDQNKDALLTGNMGYPILDYIDEATEDTIFVTEFSSYQTEYLTKSPQISIIVNLFEEHLDHHGTLDNYYSSKLNLFKYQTSNDYALYFKDNVTLNNYVESNDYLGKKIKVTFEEDLNENYYCDKSYVYHNGTKIYDLSDERNLVGMHNINNIMFALAVARIFKLNLPNAIKSINEFKGLKHRLEFVGTYKDISFYDDTIATIPEACISAINSLGNIDTVILGGMDRGIDYSSFANDLLKTNVRNFICMPDTGKKVANDLIQNKTDQFVYEIDELEDAVKKAFEVTKKGMGCLLSPAAPSYNKYKNFEEKGDLYVEYIKKLSR